jgi:Asp-tRNA(Asn)/Glu-tRNA(Gln) amidotransferase B subunit
MIGEIYCIELGLWGFVSYEVSARMSEMFKTNPSLFQRTMMRGKTGAKYYGYRISPDVQPYMIHDEDLKDFYKKIKS